MKCIIDDYYVPTTDNEEEYAHIIKRSEHINGSLRIMHRIDS